MRIGMIVAWSVFVAAAGLSGCTTTAPRSEDVRLNGAGFAVTKNGEYFSFDDEGRVASQCLLCDDTARNSAACEAKAAKLGMPVCTVSEPKSLMATPRGTLMCAAYGPTGPLPPVPYGAPGYSCYKTSPTSCFCVLN